ncbi:Ig-like domain-containing protein [Streptomyces boninensis]|uniref:Ig-like domain-containing protein n=1 Tax=Streptomyces boninensis TaxID=2039455 RepID=UPI003B213E64
MAVLAFLVALVAGPPAAARAQAAFSVKVDFGAATTVPVSGFVLDYGQGYGARTGSGQGSGLTYGWVGMTGSAPLSLVGNGRDRGTAEPNRLLATLMHMQLPASSAGVKAPGRWEIAVPNDTYRVTVTTGDATSVDSAHALQIEDQNAIDRFTPTTSTRYQTRTVTPRVTDGRLTISPATGTNTKITHLEIAPVADAAQHPEVRATTPANTATGVPPTSSIVADLRLVGAGVDAASLTSSTVRLTEAVSGAAVATRVITSGGGDVINVSPTTGLKPNTRYLLEVTSGAKDLAGRTFTP